MNEPMEEGLDRDIPAQQQTISYGKPVDKKQYTQNWQANLRQNMMTDI